MGKSIRRWRAMADLSQFDLARRCGIERTRLSLAENGHVELRPEEKAAVERALLRAIEQRASELQAALTAQAVAV